jgi:molybdate-binding protein
VRERFGGRRMLVVNLTRWRQGLLVAAGNPLGVREVGDLARLDGRFARREEGAGASTLLKARADAAGLALPDGPLARSHGEVAQLVRWRVADAGMAIEAAALAAGLSFVPLTEERFDLVMPEAVAAQPPVSRLLDALAARAFRAEARALPGYDASLMGQTTRVA